MNPEEFRRHGHSVVDLMADYLGALPDGPVWQPVPAASREALSREPLPVTGRAFDALMAHAREHVLPYPFGNGHPRFFGWGNPPPALEGVLAELIAAAMNPSCAGGDQAAVHLERGTVRWLAELVGFTGGGLLSSGGAAGALTALAAARHRAAMADGWNDRVEGFTGDRASKFVIYVSTETHSCQHKAAQLLGFGERGIRIIPTDADGRMDVALLEAAIDTDRQAGLLPCCVVATAGIVATGVVDPLRAIADICDREGVWFHVDGSLGGFGILDPRVAHLFDGLDNADSLTLDPHKWLSVPIDCAVILTRDLDDLRAAFSLVSSYLRGRPGDDPWFSEYIFDQTRPFRALKLWATLAATGRDEFRARISRNRDQATNLAAQIRVTPQLALVTDPELNIVTFRYVQGDDDLNRAIPAAVQRAGDVFLIGTRVGGREALRACFMHFDTSDHDVDRIIPAVIRAADELLARR
ncbi:MAG TPA: aminotransferase class V-fold PLP-dependent enzyme [Acidimicrobiales bacterium]|nr:aminotransferase class V-fold PLP-dependent enzyme [Acidimicrobiales bacterium]